MNEVNGLKETGTECSDTLCQFLPKWLMELRGREILRRDELEDLEELLRRQDTIVLVRMLRVTRIVEVRLAAAEQIVVGKLVKVPVGHSQVFRQSGHRAAHDVVVLRRPSVARNGKIRPRGTRLAICHEETVRRIPVVARIFGSPGPEISKRVLSPD